MADAQMINIGQLVREYATEKKVMSVGFGTYSGTTIAAREWGESMLRMNIPAAIEGSWDSLLHELGDGTNNILIFKNDTEDKNKLSEEEHVDGRRGQRAIGVVYNPEYEMYGNYVPTNLTKRYDAFLHIDKTRALQPLHLPQLREDPDLPETYPYGL